MEDPIFFVINYAFDAYFIVEVRMCACVSGIGGTSCSALEHTRHMYVRMYLYMYVLNVHGKILICKFEHQFLLVARSMEYLMNVLLMLPTR